MAVPTIHKVTTAFDDRNMFLQVALGAIALLRRLHALVRRHAPPRSAPRALPESGPDEDVFLDLVLGLVSLSTQLMRHRAALRVKAARSGTRTAVPAPPATVASLRQLLE